MTAIPKEEMRPEPDRGFDGAFDLPGLRHLKDLEPESQRPSGRRYLDRERHAIDVVRRVAERRDA